MCSASSQPDVMDTVVAIATPPGHGGISIVRLSGPLCFGILEKIFRPSAPLKPRCLTYGQICDGEEILDEALAVKFPSPNSYTGEDVVELHCHGSPVLLEKVVRLTMEMGARLAQPGEFTKRAFLFGRLDMTEAEAVNEIVRAPSEASLRAALRQLQGGLSEQLEPLKERLLQLRTEVEAVLDFPEEELEEPNLERMCGELAVLVETTERLCRSYPAGKILREGARIVIAGRANVGKSSLLNALLGKERVIVSERAGTTRDYVEQMLELDGIPVTAIDTAGVRVRARGVEAEGARRSESLIQNADLVLAVFDCSQSMSEDDERVWQLAGGKDHIVVLNKMDLSPHLLSAEDDRWKSDHALMTSALYGTNIDKLLGSVSEALRQKTAALVEGVAVNLRHSQLLRGVQSALERGIEDIRQKCPLDQLAADLKEASDCVGQITGEVFTEEIIERIFSTFCIGK